MSQNSCPNCGAPGGGPSGCSVCGLGKDPKVGTHINTPLSNQPRKTDYPRDCFPGDVLVLTPHGQRRLDRLGEGDIVLSLDASSRLVPATIRRKVSHRAHPILRVISDDSELSFCVTKRHPVQTHRGWVRVKHLRRGDVLTHVSADGRLIEHKVLGVEKTKRVEPVYNLVVDGDHTYIVHGCVAHSFVYFRRLRTWVCTIFHPRNAWLPLPRWARTRLVEMKK